VRTALRPGSTLPYPAKVWLNGHEWAKRQATWAGIEFTSLANGFATCSDPGALQAICDRFGPEDVWRFFQRWTGMIPVHARRPGSGLLVGTGHGPG